ncbi:AAA family ATPase [Pseudodonghicola flavimaris]|uniref:Adenylate/guanylate cyclase domain-containing protein n=1 Tax=Pseudodonghicola flavimaris TaxID=3050036 RepID=A0ABT7EX09_9RHOB|nr:AAA family ATPase [Pseudodonghicola flavimaris]MDK3016881.1 adenylate/guanylate cyclase domain-containing protein [Pseudodonghicola flavimaris]
MGDRVDLWLNDLGLHQYADLFNQNDIGLRALPHVTETDLVELGISLGHRRILLAAIAELSHHAGGAEADSPPGTDGAVSTAERRQLTAMFADLVNYTEMSNSFDPEEMRPPLQRYQDMVAGGISRFGGHIAKFLGDGMLVYFGWPTAYEDHPYRAVAAGLEILGRIGEIQAPDGSPLALRIGVATGPVVVGDLVGQQTRDDGAVTGRVLNLAARIEAQATPNTLVIPAEMETLLGGMFECRDLGPMELKGFRAPQRILQVVREKTAESRYHAAHPSRGEKIVGRQIERDLLEQAWTRARAGTGEVVLLTGEAGIGKSRLVEDFLTQHVSADETDIIRLNCSPYFSKTPFHPVAQRIAQDAGLQPGDDARVITEKLRHLLLLRKTADLDHVVSVYLTQVAPDAEAAAPIVSMPPEERKDMVTRTLLEVLRARAVAHPVLMVVEDAHWIDPSTAQFLGRIVATCSDMRLMLLVTHRPGWTCDWASLHGHVTTLHIRRLDPEQVAELISQVSGKRPDPAVARDIIAKTDGVPLFVEEVTRAVFAAGTHLAGEVPPSLQGAMMARLDAVSDEAKQTALTASVFGREFYADLIARAMDRSLAAVHTSLDELCNSGLVYESGQHRDAYVFRHALLRDTAYHSMVSETRRDCHRRAAVVLQALRPAVAEREPELIARHFTEAEAPAEAFPHWKRATEMDLARSANEEALAHAKATVATAEKLGRAALPERIAARILLGRSLEGVGRLPEALDTLFAAIDESSRAGLVDLHAEAAQRSADAALMSSHGVETAYAACRAALETLPDSDERMRCRLSGQMARCTMHLGRFAESARLSHEVLRLAPRLGDKRAQFAVMMSRFFAPLPARAPDEVTNWRGRLADMQSVADGLSEIDRGRDRSLHFYVATEMGDRDMAEEALERLSEVSRARNHPQLHWVEQHGRALMAILNGQFDTAQAHAEKALRIGRQTHGPHIEGVYGVQMFTIRREQARLGEVAPVIRKLLDDNPDEMAWKPGFGVIAAELGHLDAARRILTEMAETGFDLPMDALYSTTLSYLADICVAVTDDKLAAPLYELLLPYRDITVTAGVTTVCIGAAGRRLGALAALLGDWTASEAHFERALEVDTRMRALPWIAHTKAGLARTLHGRGRPQDEKAANILEVEALEIAEKHGMLYLASTLRGPLH